MKKEETGMAIATVFVILLFVGAVVMLLGFDTVDANQVGVMKRFGKITGVMGPGRKWTGLFVDVVRPGTKNWRIVKNGKRN